MKLLLKDKLREKQEATEEWERLQMQPSELNRYEREVKEHEFSIDLLQNEIKNSEHYNKINDRPSLTTISKVPSDQDQGNPKLKSSIEHDDEDAEFCLDLLSLEDELKSI